MRATAMLPRAILSLCTLALMLLGATPAMAETLAMPKRDAKINVPVVVWGATTTAGMNQVIFDFGDGTPTVAVAKASNAYTATTHTYLEKGTYTVTVRATNSATNAQESATVDIQVFDPAELSATEVQGLNVNIAIENGLRYLWRTQSDLTLGSAVTAWSSGGYPRASTAMVVTAFNNHGYHMPADGSAPTGVYAKYAARRGLNYVASGLSAMSISNQAAGNPCQVHTDCVALRQTEGADNYGTPIAMLALASSHALDRVQSEVPGHYTTGKTFREILQRMANFMAFGLYDAASTSRGGWGYTPNSGFDGSIMGWGILAMADAEAAGIVVPAFVKSEVAISTGNVINSDGTYDYSPTARTNRSYPNPAKTGTTFLALFYKGEVADPVTKTYPAGSDGANALTYLVNRWNGAVPADEDYARGTCSTYGTNKGCGYAMFNIFKGLKLTGVTNLPNGLDWYADYQNWLVTNQTNPNTVTGGNWTGLGTGWFTYIDPFSVAFAELILSPVVLALPDAELFGTVGLAPATTAGDEGGSHTVIATPRSSAGTPIPGTTVTFRIISGPNAGLTGSATSDSNGQAPFTYTDTSQGGTDTIQAFIGSMSSNTVTMEWTPVNDPPSVEDAAHTTAEDTSATGTAVVTDVDDTSFVFVVVTAPANGTVTIDAAGQYTYTPNADFHGSDSFTFVARDSGGLEDTATVTITVTPVNDAPVANAGTNTTPEDVPVSGTATGSDVDGDAMSFAIASQPSNGTVAFAADGSYTYTPNPNFNGTDSFTFTVSDPDGAVSPAGTITITVTPVNDGPAAADSAFTTAEDTAYSGAVSGSDIDGDALSFSVAAAPAHGTVAIAPGGTYTYTPAANYNGADSFTFTVDDGQGGTAIGTVAITVTPVNDTPAADNGTNTTPENVAVSGTLTASDVDGDALAFAVASPPANGSVSVATGGNYTYTPNTDFDGTDAFTFTVSDGNGGSATGTVTIVVVKVNDPPVVIPVTIMTPEDTPVTGTLPVSDPDGDPLALSLTAGPAHGTLALAPGGGYTYTPASNYHGPDSFAFVVDDGQGGTAAGTVAIVVTPVNDAPFCQPAPPMAILTPPNHQWVSFTWNDATDLDGDALTFKVDSIFQDEAVGSAGSGNTGPDGQGVGTATAQVRAERVGNPKTPGNGRVYYITFSATDPSGSACQATLQVGVPHDQGGRSQPIGDGPLFDSTVAVPKK